MTEPLLSITDPARIARWFEAHARPLVLYARQWDDGVGAEDVVHDVFARLMRQATEPADIQTWLYRAVRNAAIDRLRSSKRRRRRETRVASTRPPWFEPRPEDLIDAESVCRQLQQVPAEARQIVVLRIWAGLTLTQIAAITGISRATAWRRYRHALAQIRERLEQSCQPNRTD